LGENIFRRNTHGDESKLLGFLKRRQENKKGERERKREREREAHEYYPFVTTERKTWSKKVVSTVQHGSA
jgi:hypothetical protein